MVKYKSFVSFVNRLYIDQLDDSPISEHDYLLFIRRVHPCAGMSSSFYYGSGARLAMCENKINPPSGKGGASAKARSQSAPVWLHNSVDSMF
jgi:hypothetical protein